MSMCRQFGGPGAVLPRPVQVWVLDAPPGAVSLGGGARAGAGDDPGRLIAALRALPVPLAARSDLIDALTASGFSLPVARWMTTNLRPAGPGGSGAGSGGASGSGAGSGGPLTWSFDLDGIGEMFESYQTADLWDLLRAPPLGLKVDFVQATRGGFGWGPGAEDAIRTLGHGVHPVDAGHWVHSDNPGAVAAPGLGPGGRSAGGRGRRRRARAPAGRLALRLTARPPPPSPPLRPQPRFLTSSPPPWARWTCTCSAATCTRDPSGLRPAAARCRSGLSRRRARPPRGRPALGRTARRRFVPPPLRGRPPNPAAPAAPPGAAARRRRPTHWNPNTPLRRRAPPYPWNAALAPTPAPRPPHPFCARHGRA
jgi:hypothetical protein